MFTRWTAFAALTLIAAASFSLDVAARGPEPEHARDLLAGQVDQSGRTLAEAKFADAPDGVDPMPTGPVSSAFKASQKALGCAEAQWPNIPVACYPN